MDNAPWLAGSVDQHVADAASLIKILRTLADNLDDAEWLELRFDVVGVLWMAGETLDRTMRPLARLTAINPPAAACRSPRRKRRKRRGRRAGKSS